MIEGLHATRRSRVLVADDTESVRSLFERLLSTDGHEVISATDGRTALDVVQRERTSSSSTWRCRVWTVSRFAVDSKPIRPHV
jgi:CheY-like chemotaxis protein